MIKIIKTSTWLDMQERIKNLTAAREAWVEEARKLGVSLNATKLSLDLAHAGTREALTDLAYAKSDLEYAREAAKAERDRADMNEQLYNNLKKARAKRKDNRALGDRIRKAKGYAKKYANIKKRKSK